MRVGKDRLSEIMSQLSSNFTPDALDDLVPSFWEPYDFSVLKSIRICGRKINSGLSDVKFVIEKLKFQFIKSSQYNFYKTPLKKM